MPISSISRLGLFQIRVDLQGPSGLGVVEVLTVCVGSDGGMRRRKNFLLRTGTLPLCVLIK